MKKDGFTTALGGGLAADMERLKTQFDAAEGASAPTKRLSASWYVALPSASLGKKPVALTLFGRPLVAWRDGNRRAVLMDRHCSHLGANLADGVVIDGCLRCPFHAWTYAADGHCVHVPPNRVGMSGLRPVPSRAIQRTYPVCEKYGYVWAWYGSETPLHPLPPFGPADEQASDFMCTRFEYATTTSVLRVVENFYDAQHAQPVHALPITSFELRVLDDIGAAVEQRELARAGAWFGGAIDFEVDRYFGPMGFAARALGLQMGQMNLRFDGYPGGCVMTVSLDGEMKYKLLQAVSPADDGQITMHMLIGILKRGGPLRRLADFALFGMQTKVAAGYDVAIWNGMKPDGGGAYSRYDRLVLRYRAFYQQWVDRVDRPGLPLRRGAEGGVLTEAAP